MVRALFFAVLLLQLVSCVEEHGCTEIGCSDAAGVTIRTESGEWAAGQYTLTLTAGGTEYACGFLMPDDLPEGVGQSGFLACEPELWAYFEPRVHCTESSDGNASSQVCAPIERQFDLKAAINGTPEGLTVVLELDDSVLVDETHVPLAYQQYTPNGVECGPVCRQANVEIDIP